MSEWWVPTRRHHSPVTNHQSHPRFHARERDEFAFVQNDALGAAQELPPFPRAPGSDEEDERDEDKRDDRIETPDRGLAGHLGRFDWVGQCPSRSCERLGAAEEAKLRIGGKD